MATQVWEPLTGQVITVPEWDARGAFLRYQDAAPVRLEDMTLGQLEDMHGRSFTQQDARDERPYCTRCFTDLPFDRFRQMEHRCGQPAPAPVPLPREVVARLPEDPAHKTRTTQPTGYVYDSGGSRRTDKRGRLMYDQGSFALCACGWKAAGATREEARWRARDHRREMAAALAERNGLADRIRVAAAEPPEAPENPYGPGWGVEVRQR
jgi:hypothetical protein